MRKGFMFLELLIVVGMLAILTVIAVPRFVDSRHRASASRVRSDFRSYAVAIESYSADNGRVPRELNTDWYGDMLRDPASGQILSVSGVMSNVISTPVAYLAEARIPDPYRATYPGVAPSLNYTYLDMQERALRMPTGFWPAAAAYYGKWRVVSVGPDGSFAHSGVQLGSQLSYDPTNGVLSAGNLCRSPLQETGAQPVAGQAYPPTGAVLLGAH